MTLSLYNAVNGTSYSDPEAIEIKTIIEVLYLGNIPLMQLQYAGNLFERYIIEKRLNKYGATLLKLPAPKLVSFYNGTKEEPDEKILKLSDSFPGGIQSDIEVTVRMIKINYSGSRKILGECKPLGDYSWFKDISSGR